MLTIRPVYQRHAQQYVARYHRHSNPTRGGVFCVGAYDEEGELRGVGIAGRPIAQPLDDGVTLEILRVCTDGARNACSMIYGALRRAGQAVGYTRFITYTLQSEPGTSLRAAGWVPDAQLQARGPWGNANRPRDDMELDLFGNPLRGTGPRVRWEWRPK